MAVPPITYVRHAMPVLTEGVHPTEWHLDDEARGEARRMADRLEVAPRIGRLVASTEPKAVETAEAIAARWDCAVVGDDRVREAIRPWVGPGYRAMVHRYLRGEEHDGWEPHADVAARMAAAVADAVASADGGPVVVVGHGLALSLHLSDRLGPEFDCLSFWSSLSFPDAWALDDTGVLHRSTASADAG